MPVNRNKKGCNFQNKLISRCHFPPVKTLGVLLAAFLGGIGAQVAAADSAKVTASSSTAAVDVSTAPAKDTRKERPLSELIDLALTKGYDSFLKSPGAERLGFSGPVRLKKVRYKVSVVPDHHAHEFSVVCDTSPDGKITANSLVWAGGTIDVSSGTVYLDGYSLRLSTTGLLLNAMAAVGEKGKVVQRTVSVDSPEARLWTRDEKQFYLHDSIKLPLSFE